MNSFDLLTDRIVMTSMGWVVVAKVNHDVVIKGSDEMNNSNADDRGIHFHLISNGEISQENCLFLSRDRISLTEKRKLLMELLG